MDDFRFRERAKRATGAAKNVKNSAIKNVRKMPGVKNSRKSTDATGVKSSQDAKNKFALAKSSPMNIGIVGSAESKISKFKPKHSQKELVGKIAYYIFSTVVPVGVYFSVFFELYLLALAIVLISKWQIFIVKPRFWWANLKTSGVDLLFKLSIVTLMITMHMFADQVVGGSTIVLSVAQLILLALYLAWNMYLRRKVSSKFMMIQALSAQLFGAIAIAWLGGDLVNSISAPTPLLVAVSWVVGYAAAQHALYAYEESAIPQLASFWALTASIMTYLQLIWAKNFLFFDGLLYVPLLPFFVIGLGLLMAKAHALVEAKQSSRDVSRTDLESLKDSLEQVVIGTLGVTLLLAILIVFL